MLTVTNIHNARVTEQTRAKVYGGTTTLVDFGSSLLSRRRSVKYFILVVHEFHKMSRCGSIILQNFARQLEWSVIFLYFYIVTHTVCLGARNPLDAKTWATFPREPPFQSGGVQFAAHKVCADKSISKSTDLQT